MSVEEMTFTQLVKKVKKQEEIIAQLIKMVAATNKRLTYIVNEQMSERETETIN